MPTERHMMTYNVGCTHVLWANVIMIRAESENFLHRVLIFVQLLDSVTPTLGALERHARLDCKRHHVRPILFIYNANLLKSRFKMP